jgi:hypothetical protein
MHEFYDRLLIFKSLKFVVKKTSLEIQFYILLAFCFTLYVAFAITPSSYGMGLSYLGVNLSPLLGEARPVRSDEWAVLTPLIQIAVRGHFSTIDQISPYHESLKGFFALPILDWSLIFKPQLWAFWLVPPAYAYSIYFGILWASFVLGYTALLRSLGATFMVAALGSVILLFSHSVQAWWTSHAPTFAFAPWPVVVFLAPIRPIVKLPLLFWTCCVWLFGLIYPPFIISGASALVILLLTFRRDSLTKANIFFAILSTVCVVSVVFLYFGDMVATMRGTIYPGQRNLDGGSFPLPMLFSHLFPYATTANFKALLPNSNECEISVVATMLPLAVLCFFKTNENFVLGNRQKISLAIFILGLSCILAWMIAPVPAALGKLFLWNLVPPIRMQWGFGLLTSMALLVAMSNLKIVSSLLRFLIFSALVFLSYFISKIAIPIYLQVPPAELRSFLQAGYIDLMPIPIFGTALLCVRYFSPTKELQAVLIASLITGAITFGSFNPLQQAFPIFDVQDSEFQMSLRQQLMTNPNGWAVVPGMYGSVLNGAGISSINHTLPVPQIEFFRKVFPEMNEIQLNEAFNRYAHIIPTKEEGFSNQSPDSVNVPIEAFQRLVPKY